MAHPVRVASRPSKKFNKQRKWLKKQKTLLARSGFFDVKWYLQRYPDVANAGVDPIEHYLRFGAAEGRDPGPAFCTTAYLAS